MAIRVYAHSANYGRNICNVDTYIRVKDIKRIKELTKELEKYGLVIEEEHVKIITNKQLEVLYLFLFDIFKKIVYNIYR